MGRLVTNLQKIARFEQSREGRFLLKSWGIAARIGPPKNVNMSGKGPGRDFHYRLKRPQQLVCPSLAVRSIKTKELLVNALAPE